MQANSAARLSRMIGLIGWFGTLLTIGIAGGFCYYYYTRSHLPQPAVRTAGVVVGLADNHTVVEFVDGSGRTHRVVSQWWSHPAAHSVGEKVDVFYKTDAPAQARVVYPHLWLWLMISVPLGIASFVFGAAFFWFVPKTISRATVLSTGPHPVAPEGPVLAPGKHGKGSSGDMILNSG